MLIRLTLFCFIVVQLPEGVRTKKAHYKCAFKKYEPYIIVYA